tara:strand:+ start:335 stop:1027 length:693 start_codon:yes stop_codon:yes gene_type:complete
MSTQQRIGGGLSGSAPVVQQFTSKMKEKRLKEAREKIARRKAEFKKAQDERKAKMDRIKADRAATQKELDGGDRVNPTTAPALPEEEEVSNIQNRILDNLREQVAKQQQDEQSINTDQQQEDKPSDDDVLENVNVKPDAPEENLSTAESDVEKSAEKGAKEGSKIGETLDEAAVTDEAAGGEFDPLQDIAGAVLGLGGAIFTELAPDKEEKKPPPQPTIQQQQQQSAFEV